MASRSHRFDYPIDPMPKANLAATLPRERQRVDTEEEEGMKMASTTEVVEGTGEPKMPYDSNTL